MVGGGWRVVGEGKRQKSKGKRAVGRGFRDFDVVGELTRQGEPRLRFMMFALFAVSSRASAYQRSMAVDGPGSQTPATILLDALRSCRPPRHRNPTVNCEMGALRHLRRRDVGSSRGSNSRKHRNDRVQKPALPVEPDVSDDCDDRSTFAESGRCDFFNLICVSGCQVP